MTISPPMLALFFLIMTTAACKGQQPDRTAALDSTSHTATTTSTAGPASGAVQEPRVLPVQIQQLQARLEKLQSLPKGMEQATAACASKGDIMQLIEELADVAGPDVDQQQLKSRIEVFLNEALDIHTMCTWEGDSIEDAVDEISKSITAMQKHLRDIALLFAQ